MADGKVVHTRTTFRMENAVSIDIDAPAERVWGLLTNLADMARWNSTIISAEGTVAVGNKVVLKVHVNPDREFKLGVVEVVPNEKLVWADGFAPMFRGVRTYTLQTIGDKTRFEMAEVMRGLMLPMIAGQLPDFGPSFEAYAADLKRESEAAA